MPHRNLAMIGETLGGLLPAHFPSVYREPLSVRGRGYLRNATAPVVPVVPPERT